MGWKYKLDEAIIAADLRLARRPAGVGWYGRVRLTRAINAAAHRVGVSLPEDAEAPQLVGTAEPVAATVELLQRARLGGLAGGLSRDEVGSLYWGLQDRRRQRGPGRKRALVVAAAALVGLGASVAVLLVVTGGPPTPTEPATTTSGRLAAADEEAWVGTLTAWAVALDALSENRSTGSTAREARELTNRVKGLRDKATGARPGTDLGPEVAAALEIFMKAAEASSRPGRNLEREDDLIATALRNVNDALRDAGRPYFIDHAMLMPARDRIQIAAFVFHIEDTRRFRTPDGAAIAHVVRRLDALSIQQALLGYTKDNMDVALVRADMIERTAQERLAPALADGGPIALPIPKGADAKAWATLLAQAGVVVRAALGDRPRDLKNLGARYAISVMGHEAQHRVDYDGPALGVPDAIEVIAGGDTKSAEHTARELSAYTAELVHDPAWAKLGVMNLLGHLVGGSESAEAVSAAMILSGLDAGLGHEGQPLVAGEATDVARAIEIAEHILAASDADIAATARALWAGWFGRPLALLGPE